MRKESKAREVKPLRTTPIAGNHRTVGTLVGTLTNTIFVMLGVASLTLYLICSFLILTKGLLLLFFAFRLYLDGHPVLHGDELLRLVVEESQVVEQAKSCAVLPPISASHT